MIAEVPHPPKRQELVQRAQTGLQLEPELLKLLDVHSAQHIPGPCRAHLGTRVLEVAETLDTLQMFSEVRILRVDALAEQCAGQDGGYAETLRESVVRHEGREARQADARGQGARQEVEQHRNLRGLLSVGGSSRRPLQAPRGHEVVLCAKDSGQDLGWWAAVGFRPEPARGS
jgi:hypothetical protein